ncbi:ATP-binding cassette domain-containing protein [Candidatus Gracilibacteria bacterium]|nr:ATP-binding cassette domain-containing protein [Candidatus Gracilibacteria bacterium]
MNNLITATHISITIDHKTIIDDVSISIHSGQIVGVVGPNGGGKSTLVKALVGIQQISSGTITRSKDLRIGYLPQRPPQAQDIPLTVDELWRVYEAYTDQGNALIERFQLTTLKHKQVRTLSGGELQKVFIVSSLAHHPQLIILDEPSASIDSSSDNILDELIQEQKALGTAIILISHDIDSIAHQADTLVCLNQKIICAGKPQMVLRSEEFKEIISDAHHHHQH